MSEQVECVYESSEGLSIDARSVKLEETPAYIELMQYKWEISGTKTDVDSVRKIVISVKMLSRYTFNDKVELSVGGKFAKGEKYQTVKQLILEKSNVTQDIEIDCTVMVSKENWEYAKFSAHIGVYPHGYITDEFATASCFNYEKRPHDVVIVIGEKKFYVHKVYLATWSRYFDRLFFGEFKEKNQEEVTIEEVDPDEFNELLEFIHPDVATVIDDLNVLYILKLADRFEMPSAMSKCGTYLQDFENCPQVSLIDRLELADKHNLVHLQVTCLERIHDMDAVDLKNFHDENRARLRELSPNTLKNLI